MEAVVVLTVGTLVGFISGLFGVGGGFLTVPALYIFAGVPIHVAVGSSACQILGPATTGMLHRREHNNLYWQLALTMFGGILVGLHLGLRFLNWSKNQPDIEPLMLGLYLGLLVTLAVIVVIECRFSPAQRSGPRTPWVLWPPRGNCQELDGRAFSLPVVAVLGIVVGMLNGGLGMGGAIVTVPARVRWRHDSPSPD